MVQHGTTWYTCATRFEPFIETILGTMGNHGEPWGNHGILGRWRNGVAVFNAWRTGISVGRVRRDFSCSARNFGWFGARRPCCCGSGVLLMWCLVLCLPSIWKCVMYCILGIYKLIYDDLYIFIRIYGVDWLDGNEQRLTTCCLFQSPKLCPPKMKRGLKSAKTGPCLMGGISRWHLTHIFASVSLRSCMTFRGMDHEEALSIYIHMCIYICIIIINYMYTYKLI